MELRIGAEYLSPYGRLAWRAGPKVSRNGRTGASVVVNYASDKAGADNTVAKITKSGGKAIAIQGQVGKTTDVARLFNERKGFQRFRHFSQ